MLTGFTPFAEQVIQFLYQQNFTACTFVALMHYSGTFILNILYIYLHKPPERWGMTFSIRTDKDVITYVCPTFMAYALRYPLVAIRNSCHTLSSNEPANLDNQLQFPNSKNLFFLNKTYIIFQNIPRKLSMEMHFLEPFLVDFSTCLLSILP